MSKNVPYLPQVEAAVLGYCFSDDTVNAWSTLVRMSDDDPISLFYDNDTRVVATAISKSLANDISWNESSILDTLTVITGGEMTTSPRETIMALTLSTSILNEGAFVSGVKQLVEKRTLRKSLKGLERIVAKITDPEDPPTPDDVNQELSHVMLHSAVSKDIRSMRDIFDELETRTVAPWVIPTGVSDLDDALGGGYQPGRIYVMAAETKIGKTTMAMNSAVSALENDAAVVFLSLETLELEFTGKILATESFIPQKESVDLMYGRITEDEIDREDREALREGREFLKESKLYPMFASDIGTGFFSSLTGAVMTVKSRHGQDSPMVLIVDHLQLSTDGHGDDRQELEQRTKGLKRLATDLEIPVILLSQLNRGTTPGEMPKIGALRGSGAIAADADAVIMLNRKSHYDDTEPDHIMDISVPVARMGTPTSIQALWDGERNTITDISGYSYQQPGGGDDD